MAASENPVAGGWTPPDSGAASPAQGRLRRIGATSWPGAETPSSGVGAWRHTDHEAVTRQAPTSLPPSYVYSVGPGHPRYREALRAGPTGVWSGAGLAALWFLIGGLLSTTQAGYVWVTVIAALLAWVAALLLARYGDRGAAAGVAAVSGVALGVAGLVVEWNALHGTWILW